jgi:uncharacterized alkaline shock family protein YloU
LTETSQQRTGGSPLHSDRGTTKIADGAVLAIANAAAGEVDGAYLSHGGTRLPGDNSPTVGEFLGNVTGGSGRPRGISVEVGETQAAVDLTINVAYGKAIPQVTEALRRNVIQKVESLTGLEATEVNITVNDIDLPQG